MVSVFESIAPQQANEQAGEPALPIGKQVVAENHARNGPR